MLTFFARAHEWHLSEPGGSRHVAELRRAAAVLVAFVAFLPFLRGALSGQSFYFRDLSHAFIPLREYAVDGLRHGEVRYWNPYVHEGVPVPHPPVSYPLDALQVLFRSESSLSLLLALHVPFAALAFMALARGLGVAPTAAAGGALVYALGGFALSCVNLYVYVEAMAWVPLFLLTLLRAGEGGGAWPIAAALTTAMAISTLGAEVVVQALVVAVVLAMRRGVPARYLRLAAGLALGLGLAAPTILVAKGLLPGSERAVGFDPRVVLAQSVHPFTLLQVVIGGLYGDLSNLVNRWWGQNFFPNGFPYILSLYLGATVLTLAWVGARHGKRHRVRLVLLAFVAVVVCVGRWAGLQPFVEAFAPLRAFRYPTKAFFTVHLVVALLAASGLDVLADRDGPAWRSLRGAGLVLGGLLVALRAVPSLLPGATRRFEAAFFSPRTPWPLRVERFDFMLKDAFVGGLVALAAVLVAAAVLSGRMQPTLGRFALVGLIAADLLRTGAGLNPMVTRSFFQLSPEMTAEAAELRARGRTYTCDFEASPAYWRARALRSADHDAWTFAVSMETLTPNLNMRAGVATAYSRDLTSLVPLSLVPGLDAGCASFGAIADRLRSAGVTDVVSLDDLDHPDLRLRSVVAPARIAPLSIRTYELARPLPLRFVAMSLRPAPDAAAAESLAREPGFEEAGGAAIEGTVPPMSGAAGRIVSMAGSSDEIEMVVETDRPTAVVMREAYAPGWSAWVNESPAPVLRANGRYRAVPVPAGSSRVVLRYRPPGLAAGLVVSGFSLACLGVIGVTSLSRAGGA